MCFVLFTLPLPFPISFTSYDTAQEGLWQEPGSWGQKIGVQASLLSQ